MAHHCIKLFIILLWMIRALASASGSTFTANEAIQGSSLTQRHATYEDEQETNVDQTSSIDKILQRLSLWKESKLPMLDRRPFVTLTFAQSADGKIAIFTGDDDDDGAETGTTADRVKTSSNFPISGPESLLLTHALRSSNDAILVGGTTFFVDNPRLSNRLWKDPSDDSLHQPRPVILDTHLQHLRGFFSGERKMKASKIIVCCCADAAREWTDHNSRNSGEKGITILPCQVTSDGKLDLSSILCLLKEKFGIRSLMVEGGAAVLSSFLREGFVDGLCLTISPMLLCERGLPAFSNVYNDAKMTSDDVGGFKDFKMSASEFLPLGEDCILIGQWQGGV